MTLLEHKQRYSFERFQAIIFNGEGRLLDSCNALFDLSKHAEDSVYDVFPILEGVKDTLLTFVPNDSQKIHIPRIEFSFGGKFLICDFTFSAITYNDAPAYLWIIQDLTEQYNYLFVMQQERNESIIEGQQLRIENEILALQKDIALLNKLRQARKELNVSVASELEAPLNKIMALTAKLKDTALTQQEANYLAAIEASVTILDDQLIRSRPAQLDLLLVPPDRTSIQLSGLMWNVLKIFEYNNQIKESPFYLHVKPDFPPIVVANKPRVAQLLHNFIQHAIFSWQSISTTLTASVVEIKPTHCRLEFLLSCNTNLLQDEQSKALTKQINEDITALASNLKGQFTMFLLPEDNSLLMKLSIPFRLPDEKGQVL